MPVRSGSGYRPASFDARDYPLDLRAGPDETPPRLRLAHPFPARDQRNVPCCVSAAIVVAMEALDQKRPPAQALSILFHYYVARPSLQSLGAIEVRDGLRAAAREGICREPLHAPAFDRAGALARPSPAAYRDAETRKLVERQLPQPRLRYYLLEDSDRVAQWKRTLALGYPIVAGFFLTAAYRALRAGATIHPDVSGQTAAEGHAVAVLGYDDAVAGGAFFVKDSRGPSFGEDGSWQLPYHLVATRLIVEAWALEAITYD